MYMHNSTHSLDKLWLKAAVAGGLWASVEIIVGSFLHNIRIPFAGGVLASFGVMLMVAFYRMWPEKGLIWRAGVVCALMKSISPSAIILGPMLGILSEAILLDVTIRLLGRSLPSMMLAGGIAVSAAFAQKIFNILIIYGMSLVNIYLNLFDFAARQIGYTHANPWVLIFILAGVYFVLGLGSATAGYFIGQKSLALPAGNQIPHLTEKRDLFSTDQKRHYSSVLLFFNLFAIPGGILLMNHAGFFIALPLIMIYITFCLFYYPVLWRRLKKPVLWMQLLIIVFLSGFFWKSGSGINGLLAAEGLLVGLEMAIRAILVITGFTGISSELRSPLVRAFLFKRGLRQVYSSVSLAFQALPAMLESSVKPRDLLRRPFKAVAQMLASAGKWEKEFANQDHL
jgi:hypothetical protein